MKTQIGIILGAIILIAALTPSPVSAQSVAFTYQGQLNDGVNRANGTYDLQFTLYNSTNIPGAIMAGPITNSAAVISNGLFTANIDFETNVFTGADRWLEIGVRTNGASSFTTVSPRQKITPAPYALTATYLANVVANNTNSLSIFATVGGGYGNAALGYDSTVGGGAGNSSLTLYATVAGGGLNNALNTGGTIGGGYSNINSGIMATIAGGWQNLVTADTSTIAGGYQNTIETNAVSSTISGGSFNIIQIDSSSSVIAGGTNNTIQPASTNSVIGGGIQNITAGAYTTIAGGRINSATNKFATVAGGELNVAGGDISTIGGGDGNVCLGFLATIGGGQFNMTSNLWSTVAGGRSNFAGGTDSTVGGGIDNFCLGDYSIMGGGFENFIGYPADYSFIGGGQNNQIIGTSTQSAFDTIGGGDYNTIQTNAFESTISGGGGNMIETNADTSTIGGGRLNTIQIGAFESVIGGGYYNTILSGAHLSTIGGGFTNTVGGISSTVGGGIQNTAGGGAATVGGGSANVASGDAATVPGGVLNVAGGDYSFAAGRRAKALHQGAFVWADSQGADFTSTANDQFLIRAQGGVGVGTASPQAQFNVNGTARIEATPTSYNEGLTLNLPTDMASGSGYGGIHFHSTARGGAYGSGTIKWGIFYNYAPEVGVGGNGFSFVQNNTNTRLFISTNGNVGIGTINPTNKLMVVNARCDGSSWINASDRNLKQDFASIDAQAVLARVAALPVTTWSYKTQPEQKHLGPVAQDFHAAFGLGEDDTSISTVDESGVALAAIQGLNQKLNDKDVEIQDLKRSVADLKKLVQSLAERK